MNNNDFDKLIREGEYFHNLVIPNDCWSVVRVDGRSFHTFTKTLFDHPFDELFRDLMVTTAFKLMNELDGIYAFTESDEISILFPRNWNLFSREVEKIVSISASLAGAIFNRELINSSIGNLVEDIYPVFDSRIWIGVSDESVMDYFLWRQNDTARNALFSWCHWTAIKNSNNKREYKELEKLFVGHSVRRKHDFLYNHGINYNDLPNWQKRGTGLYKEAWIKTGFNPKTNEKEKCVRYKIVVDYELPMKLDYKRFIEQRLH